MTIFQKILDCCQKPLSLQGMFQKNMATNYFQFGNSDKNRFVSVLKVIFGAVCIAIGIYWAIYSTAWGAILFLFGFGFYEVWSGLGKADRYIDIDKTVIKFKKTIFLSAKHIEASELGKIEIFPLKIIFHFKEDKKTILRLGTTYIDTNEKIVDALVQFANQNAVDLKLQTVEK